MTSHSRSHVGRYPHEFMINQHPQWMTGVSFFGGSNGLQGHLRCEAAGSAGLRVGVRLAGVASVVSRFFETSRAFTVDTTAAATLLGSVGMTQLVSASVDDDFLGLSLPFLFPFYGVNLDVFIGSNSYLTFGVGSGAYSGLSCTNPGKGLLIAAADRSWQQVYKKDNGDGSFRTRYEGSSGTYGTVGSPSSTWEATLYRDGKIQLVIGASNTSGSGISSITNGIADAQCVGWTNVQNQSYVFAPSVNGAAYTIYTGARVISS